jgi:hypothetical protein
MTIAHEPDHETALRDLARAGSAGLVLGDEISLGVALHLALHSQCTITNAAKPPQRAVVTAQGVAFSRRSAWA